MSFAQLDSDVVEEFRDVIFLEKTKLSFTEQETIKKINFSIHFPEGFSKQGIHELRIGAVQAKEAGEGVSIVAGNEIVVLINVSVEYSSDKFARIKKLTILNIRSDEIKKGEKGNISILVKSESDVKLYNVYGKIKVVKDEQEIRSIETNKINLNIGEENSLNTIFDSRGFEEGTLILLAEVFYDSKSETMSGILNIVGEQEDEQGDIKNNSFPLLVIIIFLLTLIAILLIVLVIKRKKDQQSFYIEKNL